MSVKQKKEKQQIHLLLYPADIKAMEVLQNRWSESVSGVIRRLLREATDYETVNPVNPSEN